MVKTLLTNSMSKTLINVWIHLSKLKKLKKNTFAVSVTKIIFLKCASFITKTRLCDILHFFTAVKMEIFR